MKRERVREHGAAVAAPEETFSVSDSPTPVGVVSRRRGTSARPPASGGFVGKVALALRFVVGLAIVVGSSVAVAFSVHRYALSTPRFGVKEVSVTGHVRLGRDEVVGLAGIELGKNLLAFDTRAAERQLVESPWVKSARVTRELPDTLKVELEEYRPAAVASLGQRLYLVTLEGEAFKELRPEDPTDLPVVTGISADELARDKKGATERIRLAVDLLEKYRVLPLAAVHPAEEVHNPPSGHVVLVVGKDGIALELGLPPFPRKLGMAAEVLGSLRRKGRTPGIIFLDNEAHPERVVVRMK